MHGRAAAATTTMPARLRVTFSRDTFDDDSHTCYRVGDQVDVGDSATTACGDELRDNCRLQCAQEHLLTAGKREALARILPAVSSWLAAAFAINEPVDGPLAVSDAACGFGGQLQIPEGLVCACRHTYNTHTRAHTRAHTQTHTQTHTCTHANISEASNVTCTHTCMPCPHTPTQLRNGAAGADVLILVTARPIPSATLAFAGHCQEDEGQVCMHACTSRLRGTVPGG